MEMGGAPRGAGTHSLLGPGRTCPPKGESMRPRLSAVLMVLVVLAGMVFLDLRPVHAGQEPSTSGYKVLEPIRHGSLTVFPVVASRSYATGDFMTLDEGLRSGDVIVTEYGNVSGLIRRRPAPAVQVQAQRAEVNRLVLINNSKRPLLLLAGEIVTGGKQDRVIGKDRIVPPESDPVDLGVFCVEPGRWVASSEHFGTSGATYAGVVGGGSIHGAAAPGTMMAQPSVRAKAMGDKDQAEVWAEVRKQQQSMTVAVAAAPTASRASTQEIQSTSSYARVMENKDVKEKVDEIAAPIQQNYESLIKQLRDRKAVGVVVAVNGRIIWADVFASTELLERYWPKLVRSYASEAVVTRAKGGEVTPAQAESFLVDMEGRRETIEIEPGVYRHSEANGDGFKAFALTSLLPKTGFEVHIAKMAD
jgi:ARG and Rhodanese-Phosphatase-superfamily-associated Protein domain